MARKIDGNSKQQQQHERRHQSASPQDESLGWLAVHQIEFSKILDFIGDGISIQDRDYKILYQNSAHRQLTGDHLGEYCYQAYSRQEVVCSDCPVALALQDGRAHTMERSTSHPEGVRQVEITASPLVNPAGKIVAVIEVVRDISTRKRAEAEKDYLISRLQEALQRVKTLKGMLPICSACKKVRDDKGYWKQLEAYVRDHSDADFSHGICPECAKKLYPEFYRSKID